MQRRFLLWFLAVTLCLPLVLQAQTKSINGEIIDRQSDEPIPFATVQFVLHSGGVLTDSLGRFSISLDNVLPNDSLLVTSVGYSPSQIPVSYFKDSVFVTIHMV
ncbi:MAG: carboxypeptidase-like regulatory domain-containing protein, partial [Bacteroidetes bacterium]|nr:carboxypeptidase-like regulatory domain-containing protein [Bacteroidota bacterium]